MPIYEHRGQRINISDTDTEYKGYFDAAREHPLGGEEMPRLRPAPG